MPWWRSDCVSRDHELATVQKKDPLVRFDSSGTLNKSSQVACDAQSEMSVRYYVMRRGLSLAQANVIAYSNHDVLLERSFANTACKTPHLVLHVSA